MTITRKTRAALTIAIILWASAFVGIRAGLQGYSPEGLALLRYLIASFAMSIVYFKLPVRSQISLPDKIGLLFVGVVGIGIYNLTLNYGEVNVSSGVASFITSQSPVVTTIFAVMFLGETLSPQRIAGFLVSMVGVALIATGEIGALQMTPSMMYVFAAMIAGSCYSIMQKPFLKKYNAIEATTYMIWGGTLFLLTCTTSHLRHDVTHASLTSTLIVVYLGLFPASLAYVCWGYILRQMPISRAVSYTYVMPFIAALLGWALLGETPAMISIVGALIAIAGVWMVSHSYKTYRVTSAAPPLEAEAA